MAAPTPPGESDDSPASGAETRFYPILLRISHTIARERDLPRLFRSLKQRLARLVNFDGIYFLLYDRARHVMRLALIEGVPQVSVPVEVPVGESASAMALMNGKPFLFADLQRENRFPRCLAYLRDGGIRSLFLVPLRSARRKIGTLGFGAVQPNLYHQSDQEFLQAVGEQVAVAVESALHRQEAEAYQKQLVAERDHARLLLDVNNVLVSSHDIRSLFGAISGWLRDITRHDFAVITLAEEDGKCFRLHAVDFPPGSNLPAEGFSYPMEGSPGGAVYQTRRPLLLLDTAELGRYPSEIVQRMLADGVRSACWVPLITPNGVIGTLALASREPAAFTQNDVDLLARLAVQVAIAVENAETFRRIAELKDRLAEEKLYLEEEIRSELHFEEIIGESTALKRILEQVQTVASTGAAVLILGETGTGKELIARAIHRLSARKDATFVKVNCSAIPAGLLESELFGHERGAFTGALSQKLGRVELADQGTLFLDEIGDVPLELQPKLLRVLQEHEFERLGSNRTIRASVRVIAATNRNLAEMVAHQQFRRDLYYRLNVFPIHAPPLRERPEDIPMLVRYFAQKFARGMDRNIQTVPRRTLQALERWNWPGNVRELENLIERAVILSPGPVLHVPLAELKSEEAEGAKAVHKTLQQAEREYIQQVLRETKGVISGPAGAAARLGLKRTTLNYKMKKLGIRYREH